MPSIGIGLRRFLLGSEFESDPSNPNSVKENIVTFVRAVFGEVLVTFLFITCVVATGCNLARAQITDPAA
jgi:glycerol uptake facilitator-like aquaporin